MAEAVAETDDGLDEPSATAAGWWQDWPRWAPPATAVTAAVFGTAVIAGWLAGHRSFVGLPGVALPGGLLLLIGSVAALATWQPWGRRLPWTVLRRATWSVAVLCLAGSCWLLLDLCQLALTGTVTNGEGRTNWLPFLERLALTLLGGLFTATALTARPTVECAQCGRSHPAGAVRLRRPVPRAAPVRIRRIAYAGCVGWLPYVGLHTLGALGVPGIEPNDFRPPADVTFVFFVGIGLSVFLLLGLVQRWGMVFPRWVLWLAGRPVPRLLPIVPVWLISPTLILYGFGSGVYAVLLATGVLTWDGGDVGLVGYGQPISFVAYGAALAVAAASYQSRTRPVPVPGATCPVPRGSVAA